MLVCRSLFIPQLTSPEAATSPLWSLARFLSWRETDFGAVQTTQCQRQALLPWTLVSALDLAELLD